MNKNGRLDNDPEPVCWPLDRWNFVNLGYNDTPEDFTKFYKDSNDYFSILEGNKANFFKIEDIFRTLETNLTFVDILREYPNHKKIPLLNLLNKSPNNIVIESEEDIYIVLTINQSPVGLIHNKFDRYGAYAHSHVRFFINT